MPTNEQTIRVYQELADWYERQGQAKLRDWFLVLAADAALSCGRADEAERLRGRLLQHNPHHLLRPYLSLTEAMKAPDVQNYIADLRRSYPPETAEHLLQSLRASASGKQSERPAPPTEKPSSPRTPQRGGPPPDEPERELKVYRLQTTQTEDLPGAPPPRPAARPAAKAPPAHPAAARPTAPLPRSRPVPVAQPTKPPAQSSPPVNLAAVSEAEEKDAATGFWVSMLLCVVTLVAGVGWAAYTLLRPFLPPEWFPP
jgi:hypothetical protein